jgi:acid stress chaperone HdeB
MNTVSKIVTSFVFAVCVLASAPAGAEVIDLSTVRCREFSTMPKETIAFIMVWLDGYHTEEDDPPVLDTDKSKEDGEKILAYCETNPAVGIITAAERVLWK